MAYHLYMFGVEWPELPSDYSISTGSKNKTSDLLDGRTISFLKSPGLKEFSLSLTLPEYGKRPAEYYISLVEKYKKKQKPTQFILTRATYKNEPLEDVNLKVSVEGYSVSESASAPFERQLSISLREYVDYETQTVSIKTVKENGKTQAVATIKKERSKESAPTAKTYTVKDGDNLWKIAARYLGSSSKYLDILNANRDTISNPNILRSGQVLKIP